VARQADRGVGGPFANGCEYARARAGASSALGGTNAGTTINVVAGSSATAWIGALNAGAQQHAPRHVQGAGELCSGIP